VTTATTAIICSVAGGLCEFGGLAFVVRGIGKDRQRARELFAKQARKAPERKYPLPLPNVRTASRPWLGAVSYGPKHEMQQLGKYVQQLETSIANGFLTLRKALDADRDHLAETLDQEIVENDNTLRQHLRYVLAGSIQDRKVGAGLLGAGIILSVIGSVLAV
jgi:hypothetical protein